MVTDGQVSFAGVKVGDQVLHYWHDLGEPTFVTTVSVFGTFQVSARPQIWYNQSGQYCNEMGKLLVRSGDWAGSIKPYSKEVEAHYWLHLMQARLEGAMRKVNGEQALHIIGYLGMEERDAFLKEVVARFLKVGESITHE